MSAFGTCTVNHYHYPSSTEDGRFRAALDDVIIVPLVFITLAANKILRFILSILMQLLDYAFPLAMQLVWLPLFAVKILGNGVVAVINTVALSSAFQDETSAVECGDPAEPVVAPAQD
jgi:hypothetical protein